MKKVLFLSLKTFSNTGGIEQVNKNWLHSLDQLACQHKIKLEGISAYDESADKNYIKSKYVFFKGNRILFSLNAILKGIRSDIVILPHLNLSVIGLLIKFLNPKVKIWIQLHGIEAWKELSGLQERMLHQADRVLSVSRYTAGIITNRYPDVLTKLQVVSNYLDPLINYNHVPEDRKNKREQLGISEDQKLIITIGRLSSGEKYKGYDKVVQALERLKDKNIFYHIIGKYDEDEFSRISDLISSSGLSKNVKLTGYISNEEVRRYYQAADLYVMPSTGEGFGVVFIEAMANGLPVIAGNKDGSVDAVEGIFPSLCIDPDNMEEMAASMNSLLQLTFNEQHKSDLSERVKEKFNSKHLEEHINKMIL